MKHELSVGVLGDRVEPALAIEAGRVGRKVLDRRAADATRLGLLPEPTNPLAEVVLVVGHGVVMDGDELEPGAAIVAVPLAHQSLSLGLTDVTAVALVALARARVEGRDRELELGVVVDQHTRVEPPPLARALAMEVGDEAIPGRHLLGLDPASELGVIELFDLLVDPNPLAVRPRDIVVAGHEAKAPTLEPEGTDEGLEEELRRLELLLARALGQISRHDHEVGRRPTLERPTELVTKAATERVGLDLGKTRVGAEVEIREVEDDQRHLPHTAWPNTKPGRQGPGFGC